MTSKIINKKFREGYTQDGKARGRECRDQRGFANCAQGRMLTGAESQPGRVTGGKNWVRL